MFEIVNDKNKRITISLHLEQIFAEILLKKHIETRMALFYTDKITATCVDNLLKIKFTNSKYADYETVIDFQYIKYIESNLMRKFLDWLNKFPNKKICNCRVQDDRLKNFEISQDSYRHAFTEYGKKYIRDKCCDSEGYDTQTGVHLGVYINLKEIIEDTKELILWCYIIASDLYNIKYFEKKNRNNGILLFCHTLNGTNIAGILSLLLDIDLMYVDHLGPYNKLNKINFQRDIFEPREYIIIADMVCQGNEILRAKNIVECLGGTVKGCAGILKLDISLLSFAVDAFAIRYLPEEARNDLGYTIRTKLCEKECNS